MNTGERVVRRAITERLVRASADVAQSAQEVEGAEVCDLTRLTDACWLASSRIQDVAVAIVALERRDIDGAARMMARLDGEKDVTAWLLRGAEALSEVPPREAPDKPCAS